MFVRCLLAASLAGPLLLPGAHAKEDGLWPGGTIRVYDGSDWPRTVDIALGRWNSAGAGVRFELTRDRGAADVVVVSEAPALIRRHCPEARAAQCQAYSHVGYKGRGGPARVILPPAIPMVDRFPTPFQVRLTVHELGHVIGLRHVTDPCQVMSPDVDMPRCARLRHGPAGQQLCGPTRADAERVARLYGGRVRAGFAPYCRMP